MFRGTRPDQVLDAGQMPNLTDADTDDARDYSRILTEGEQQGRVPRLMPKTAPRFESALTYEEETPGRIMQRILVAVPRTYDGR